MKAIVLFGSEMKSNIVQIFRSIFENSSVLASVYKKQHKTPSILLHFFYCKHIFFSLPPTAGTLNF